MQATSRPAGQRLLSVTSHTASTSPPGSTCVQCPSQGRGLAPEDGSPARPARFAERSRPEIDRTFPVGSSAPPVSLRRPDLDVPDPVDADPGRLEAVKATSPAHGYIERKETEIIKKELADGVINKSEAEFLVDLRNSAPKAVPKFHQFVFEVVKKASWPTARSAPRRPPGSRSSSSPTARWTTLEKAFLRDLKAAGEATSPEFDALVEAVRVSLALEIRFAPGTPDGVPGSSLVRQVRQHLADRRRELEPVAGEPARHAHLRVPRVNVDHEMPVGVTVYMHTCPFVSGPSPGSSASRSGRIAATRRR